MSDMTNIYNAVLDFLYPPKCVVCGNEPEVKKTLCKKCYGRWVSEKAVTGNTGNFLAYYIPNSKGVCRRFVLRSKRGYLRHMYNFIADEMCDLIERVLDYDVYGYVIVNVPRKAKTKRITGVDQSETIAKLIAKKLGITYVNALSHFEGTEQKKLNYTQRFSNANEAFDINESQKQSILNRKILLYDDVVTSGASTIVCSGLLMRNGAAKVDVISIGKTKERI